MTEITTEDGLKNRIKTLEADNVALEKRLKAAVDLVDNHFDTIRKVMFASAVRKIRAHKSVGGRAPGERRNDLIERIARDVEKGDSA